MLLERDISPTDWGKAADITCLTCTGTCRLRRQELNSPSVLRPNTNLVEYLPKTKIGGSVAWKIGVGEATTRLDNGYRGRFSCASKPRPCGRKSLSGKK
jgi:hypothetical protein